MNRHGLVSCSPACSAMSVTGWLFAGSTTIASNRGADAAARTRPRHRHGPHAVLRARHPWYRGVDERLVLEEVQMTPHTLTNVMRRARLLGGIQPRGSGTSSPSGSRSRCAARVCRPSRRGIPPPTPSTGRATARRKRTAKWYPYHQTTRTSSPPIILHPP